MLEHVNLKLSASKVEYQRRLPRLQRQLYELTHTLFLSGIPSIVVFEGWATSGKGSTIKVLTERLDARGFRVVPVLPPRTFETQYPWLWRFWLEIPAAGQMIFDQSWYRRVLADRLLKTVNKREWEHAYRDITEFEDQMAGNGTVVLDAHKQERTKQETEGAMKENHCGMADIRRR